MGARLALAAAGYCASKKLLGFIMSDANSGRRTSLCDASVADPKDCQPAAVLFIFLFMLEGKKSLRRRATAPCCRLPGMMDFFFLLNYYYMEC